MKRWFRSRPVWLLALVIVSAFLIWWITKPSSEEGAGRRGGQGIPVTVVHPQIKPMPVVIQELGSIGAGESVNIISQVSGVLKKIDIQPGQSVNQGDLLFEIEPGVYAADVAQAQANLERDKAQLALYKATAGRYAALAKLEYVTQQQYEESLASVKGQEAAVAADEAQLEQKKIQLGFTQIRAPISGKAGAIPPDVGDLIVANSPTPLVVINRLDPVVVNFNITQNLIQDLLTYQRAGTLKVIVMDEVGNRKLGEGDLAFIGNVVSAQTGTVQVNANIPNPNLALWPGQLVTVRLILTTEPHAIVIPSAAVQLGQKGRYVYLVENNKAVIHPVVVSRELDNETVVAEGLQPKDSVIVEIPPDLQDGAKVKIEERS